MIFLSHIFYLRKKFWFWLMVCIAIPTLANVTEVKRRTEFALQEADQSIYQALYELSVRYENADLKTQLTTTTKTLSTGPVKKIICGYFPDTSTQACPDTSTPVSTDSFLTCLVKPYPNQLGCEVHFKNQADYESLSGAVSSKKVLFIAKGPGLYPVSINKSDSAWTKNNDETFTPIGMGHINHYICYNPDGSPGDGINNGGRLGALTFCDSNDCATSTATVRRYPLSLSVSPIAKLGSIVSCLTNSSTAPS